MKLPRHKTVCALLLIILFVLWTGNVLAEETDHENVETCTTARLGHAGDGVPYRGSLRNSDYRFSAIIPEGLTGWGSGESAPFHGFMIYLDGSEKSCIDFYVGIHVDLFEDEKPNRRSKLHPHAREVRVHGRKVVETESTGANDVENLSVSFQVPREVREPDGKKHPYLVDVAVVLVTTKKDRAKTEPVYREFLSNLAFK